MSLKHLLVCLLVCSLELQASNTKNNSEHHLNQNQEFPHPSLEFILASEQTKDSKTFKVNGTYSKLDSSFLYSINNDNDLRVFASVLYLEHRSSLEKDRVLLDLTEIMYRKKNILEQSKHGVSLDLELKNYYILNFKNRSLYGFDGAFIPQLVIKKHIDRRVVAEVKLRHHFNFNNNGNDSTIKEESRIYITPTFILNKSLFLSSTLKYRRKITRSDHFSYRYNKYLPKITNTLNFRTGLMFLLSRKVLTEAYLESDLMNSGNKNTINQSWHKNYVLGAGIYLTAF